MRGSIDRSACMVRKPERPIPLAVAGHRMRACSSGCTYTPSCWRRSCWRSPPWRRHGAPTSRRAGAACRRSTSAKRTPPGSSRPGPKPRPGSRSRSTCSPSPSGSTPTRSSERSWRDFYFERFRSEFKPAVKAWIATDPLNNPKAPPIPFSMPEYKLAKQAEAKHLLADAETAARRRAPVQPAIRQLRARGRPLRRLAVLRRDQHQALGAAPAGRAAADRLRHLRRHRDWVATFPMTISI